jgi:hypothetical protein
MGAWQEYIYNGVTKSFRTGRLERELQMVQLSATRCSCIAILWVTLVSFAAITLCVASQRVFIAVSVYFVIDWVRKLLDTLSYDSLTFEMNGLVLSRQNFRNGCGCSVALLSTVQIFSNTLISFGCVGELVDWAHINQSINRSVCPWA